MDFSTFSKSAITRWKVTTARSPNYSTATSRRIRSLVRTHDANKFIDAPQFEEVSYLKQDEIQEVSSQLKILRRNHDKSAIASNSKQRQIELLKQELGQIDQMESNTGYKSGQMKMRVATLEQEIKGIKEKQNEAELTKHVYLHILERMKQTKIHLEKKNNYLNEAIRSKGLVFKEEFDKMRRARESAKHHNEAVRSLETSIRRQTKDQVHYLKQLEKNIEQREANANRREERARRQVDIIERAANEDRDRRAMAIREGLMIHRLWLNYLNWKHQTEMEKSNAIEQAFQKIRTATGLSDVEQIVERFLTREQSYKDLLESVENLQNKIVEMKDKNKEMDELIRGLDYNKNTDSAVLKKLKDDMGQLFRDMTEAKDRHSKTMIVYERVQGWFKRVLGRFKAVGLQVPEEQPEDLSELMDYIKVITKAELRGITREEVKAIDQRRGDITIRRLSETIPAELQAKTFRVRRVKDTIDDL